MRLISNWINYKNNDMEQNRHVLDWLNSIEDETIRKQAIENCDLKASKDEPPSATSVKMALATGFFWEQTTQGHDYWETVYFSKPPLREVPDGRWEKRDGKWVNLNDVTDETPIK